MSRGLKPISEANKPVVGIVYSANIGDSAESKNLAYFLSGCLTARGFAKVKLVGLNHNGSPCDLRHEYADLHEGSISFLPPGKSSLRDIKTAAVSVSDCSDAEDSRYDSTGSSQISFSHWNELEKCQVIIVAVNSSETVACSTKLASVLTTTIYHAVVISLQRGVKNGGILKDGLRSVGTAGSSTESNSVAVVEGLAAFACVPTFYSAPVPHDTSQSSSTTSRGPKTSSSKHQGHYYSCTVRKPQIMLERLSKEVAEAADGPVNLLETMGFETQFRKTLTPYSWGILLFENLYWLNTITGGDLRSTVKTRHYRRILGLMVREFRETLLKAAGSGKWKPEMGVIAAYLTPWMFEMALVAPLPDILFSAFWILLNLFGGCFVPWGDIACQGVRSPGQCDLASGRKTMAEHHLEEFITTGARHKMDTPICAAVLATIKSLEGSIAADSGIGSTSPLSRDVFSTDASAVSGRMYLIDLAYSKVTDGRWYKHPGVYEASYRMLQIFALMFLVVAFVIEVIL